MYRAGDSRDPLRYGQRSWIREFYKIDDIAPGRILALDEMRDTDRHGEGWNRLLGDGSAAYKFPPEDNNLFFNSGFWTGSNDADAYRILEALE